MAGKLVDLHLVPESWILVLLSQAILDSLVVLLLDDFILEGVVVLNL